MAFVIAGCILAPPIPDGVVISTRPVHGSVCVGIETLEGVSTVYRWQEGRNGCSTAAWSVQSAANVRIDGGNPQTVRFDIERIVGGTEEIRFSVSRDGGSVVFITAQGERILGERRAELDIVEPPFAP